MPKEDVLRNKWVKIENLIDMMTHSEPGKRPTCSRILSKDDWAISNKEIVKYGQFGEIDTYPDHFLKFYFKERLILLKSKCE